MADTKSGKKRLSHIPVLLDEILDLVPLHKAELIIDCTVGLGGHLEAFAQKTSTKARLIALDQDKEHLLYAQKRLGQNAEKSLFIHTNFVNLLQCAKANEIAEADMIFFDLGLASPHVDDPNRGFSYQSEGPLDMRFDISDSKTTAADILNSSSEDQLKRIIYRYGEENSAPRIAKAIVTKRLEKEFKTTTDLKKLITEMTSHPARQNQLLKRVFQALRIEVNKELDVLTQALEDAISLLSKDGYLVVISYHSLEDRIVKQLFKKYENRCHCPKEIPICQCKDQQKLKIVTKRPVVASQQEIADNPRSRSAKLRIAQKT